MALGTHLFLLRELVRRDFQQRYAGSILGLVWSLVQPLWQLLLLSFVFSLVMRLPMVGEATGRFWVFLLAGLLPWMALSEGVSRGTTAIADQAELVKKMRFPSALLVLTVVGTALVQQGITLGIFAVALALQGELEVSGLALLPLAVVLQVLLSLGLALLLAAFHVYLRDTAQVVGMGLQAWFYLTPVVYPLALVPARLARWLELNPLTALVGLYRRALLGPPLAPPAGLAVDPAVLAAARETAGRFWPAGMPALVVVSLGLFALGWKVFHSLEPGFSDEV